MKKTMIYGMTLMMCLAFIQCVHKDKEPDPSGQLVLEVPAFPPIEDPDPPIEEPEDAERFNAHLSIDVLKEMGTVSTEERLTPLIMEIFQSLEPSRALDPRLQGFLKTVNMSFLADVMNPEKPLDPDLEGYLKQMLELEGINLPLPELPKLPPISLTEGSNGETENPDNPQPDMEDLDEACVEEVREKYESGFRGCSLDYDSNVQAINSNYQRRRYEAEERLLQRNEDIKSFYSEKLLLISDLLKEISKIIHGSSHHENYEEIRTKLSYFGLVYAYYIRINMPLLYEYGLALNQSFYEYEIKAIDEIRDEKLEEASAILQTCIDWVNALIAEEVEKTCR